MITEEAKKVVVTEVKKTHLLEIQLLSEMEKLAEKWNDLEMEERMGLIDHIGEGCVLLHRSFDSFSSAVMMGAAFGMTEEELNEIQEQAAADAHVEHDHIRDQVEAEAEEKNTDNNQTEGKKE